MERVSVILFSLPEPLNAAECYVVTEKTFELLLFSFRPRTKDDLRAYFILVQVMLDDVMLISAL